MSEQNDFRDRLATIDDKGKRVWLFPRKPSGKYTNYRTWFSWLLLIVMIGTPFIKVNGHPIMLFDIANRHFIIFGIPFWPQDSEIFAVGLIIIFLFIILFTAVYGRLWCGWACPQTIFMEMVFRKIEYLIDGDAHKQRKLDAMPWNSTKIFKRVLKHGIFFGLAFFLGNIFLSYFIGMDRLIEIITAPPSANLWGFIIMLIFTFVFYWIYAWFREQVCTLVCPYGRLQSVLLDKNSIVVSYDFLRGEPRGPLKRNADNSGKGDCVDCHMCVDVCPTGIDIRNGQQLECINCTACMDACDAVMTKVDRPTGLIRYASYNSIKEGSKKLITGRSIGYTAGLVILLVVLNLFMYFRSDTQTTILRAAGSLPLVLDDGKIRNLYTIKIINKTFDDITIRARLITPEGSSRFVSGEELTIKGEQLAQSAIFVDLPESSITGKSTRITFEITRGDEVLETIKTNFLSP
jgi:cytochrome c oxidase accessory protein FixG